MSGPISQEGICRERGIGYRVSDTFSTATFVDTVNVCIVLFFKNTINGVIPSGNMQNSCICMFPGGLSINVLFSYSLSIVSVGIG